MKTKQERSFLVKIRHYLLIRIFSLITCYNRFF